MSGNCHHQRRSNIYHRIIYFNFYYQLLLDLCVLEYDFMSLYFISLVMKARLFKNLQYFVKEFTLNLKYGSRLSTKYSLTILCIQKILSDFQTRLVRTETLFHRWRHIPHDLPIVYLFTNNEW